MNDPLSMVPTCSKVLQTLDTMPNIMLEETTTALMVITIPLSLTLLAAKLATLMAMMTHLNDDHDVELPDPIANKPATLTHPSVVSKKRKQGK